MVQKWPMATISQPRNCQANYGVAQKLPRPSWRSPKVAKGHHRVKNDGVNHNLEVTKRRWSKKHWRVHANLLKLIPDATLIGGGHPDQAFFGLGFVRATQTNVSLGHVVNLLTGFDRTICHHGHDGFSNVLTTIVVVDGYDWNIVTTHGLPFQS